MSQQETLSQRLARLSPAARTLLAARLGQTQPPQQADARLVAYVVPLTGANLDMQMLRENLAQHLPAYMLPSSIVPIAALPLTPNGKLDRRALPDPFEHTPDEPGVFVGPRNELEQGIATLWSALLGIDQPGMDEDFFELGGHSLLVARLLAQLRERYAVDVPIMSFFQRPTIAALAESVATLQWASSQVSMPVDDERDEVEL